MGFYVCERTLNTCKEKIKSGEEISQDLVSELTFPEKVKPEEMMVPVDMRGVGEDFDDVEAMVEKLGPKKTAEAFIKAREYFEENKDKEPEEDRPKPMTAAEWSEILADGGEDMEEELFEGEEEDVEDFDEEEGPEE